MVGLPEVSKKFTVGGGWWVVPRHIPRHFPRHIPRHREETGDSERRQIATIATHILTFFIISGVRHGLSGH